MTMIDDDADLGVDQADADAPVELHYVCKHPSKLTIRESIAIRHWFGKNPSEWTELMTVQPELQFVGAAWLTLRHDFPDITKDEIADMVQADWFEAPRTPVDDPKARSSTAPTGLLGPRP